MLLNALDLMELRDWKVYLIGSISEDLDFFLKDFFMRNPSKKESVFQQKFQTYKQFLIINGPLRLCAIWWITQSNILSQGDT